MKKIYKTASILLMFILLVTNVNAKESAVSWYVSRNKEHKQPCLPSELKFCEVEDVYWCDKRFNSFTDEKKVIYLTFDAGYENGNIEKILNVMQKQNVKGTFFILDNMILKNKELVMRMIDEGHLVANHTLKHKDMTKMSTIDEFENELASLEELYENTFGIKMEKIYRPPEGKLNRQNIAWARELGYKTVMWSFAYADWDNKAQPSREFAMKKITDNLHNGEIMLLHPTSSTNAEILEDLIIQLKEQGYRFALVNELW